MKHRQYLMIFFLLCFGGIVYAGSTGQIHGTVRDAETGDPLPGANVLLEGTAIGAATDLKGEYRIPRVPPGN
ncbi:MAG: carboxypeptidase-like regulatory domain-containing protein, partial [bacterium]